MRRLALLAALAAAAPAAAYTTSEGYRVEDRGAGRFEVLASAGQSATESWCAAGEHAARHLGLGPTERLWRVSAPPRRSGEGVIFSTSPEGASAKTGLALLGGDTDGVSVGFAEALCDGLGPFKAEITG